MFRWSQRGVQRHGWRIPRRGPRARLSRSEVRRTCGGLAAPLVLLLAITSASAQSVHDPAYWAEAQRELAQSGPGFVVWETQRTGRWRIFRIDLDGSHLRQLTPDEKGRDHFCPHISPDGRRVAYLSYPAGQHGYRPLKKGSRAVLRLIGSDGTGDREIAPSARAYFEDRAVVWMDNDTLNYIDGEGITQELDLDTGRSRPLTTKPDRHYGWLINATRTHATMGWPTFDLYHAEKKTIETQKRHGGCQPYFTHDGKWGFWTGGGGGPLNRFNLKTRQSAVIINRNDARLPRERGYLYFPMVSRCGRLFAFGASNNQHDHFKADYDIFVSRMNPKTLEIIGRPVRYTFDKGCDRFPDVYMADLELGTFFGEAPHTITFPNLEGGDTLRWDFGDSGLGRGNAATYTYTRAGQYAVTARDGDRVLHGRVTITPPTAPKAVAAQFRSPRELRVVFDEPVVAGRKPSLSMASKTEVAGWSLSEDGQTLTVRLAGDAPPRDSVVIEGFIDRAQQPNRMVRAEIVVQQQLWPVDREGLCYMWPARRLVNPLDGEGFAPRLEPHGMARFGPFQGMLLTDGAMHEQDAGDIVTNACRRTNELMIEAVITPARGDQRGPARIISLSRDSGRRNFTLGQEGENLVLRLRTPKTGTNGTNPQVTLTALRIGRPQHVVVTYRQGVTTCHVDGKRVMQGRAVKGDFSNWEPQPLVFGDEVGGDRNWDGAIDAVVISNRARDAAYVKASYTAYERQATMRPPPRRLVIVGKLEKLSPVPTAKKIKPYRQALVTGEFSVDEVLDGRESSERIVVAMWAVLGGRDLAVPQVGQRIKLVLTPFDENPQLQPVSTVDELGNFEDPYYYTDEPGAVRK